LNRLSAFAGQSSRGFTSRLAFHISRFTFHVSRT